MSLQEHVGNKEPFNPTFRSPIKWFNRLIAVSMLFGSTACMQPNPRMNDTELSDFCYQLYNRSHVYELPTVTEKLVREPKGTVMTELINSNIMFIDENNVGHMLTNNPNFDDGFPSLAPNKQQVVFTRQGPLKELPGNSFTHEFTGQEGLYTISTDGANLTRLTNTPNNDRLARFSPDSSKVTFVRSDQTTDNLFIIDIDGNNLTQLTNFNEENAIFHPEFSPNGKRIAYQNFRDTYVYHLDENRLVKVSTGSTDGIDSSDSNKLWLPNSQELLITRSYRVSDIAFLHRNFIVQSDGSGEREVTTICPPPNRDLDQFDTENPNKPGP